MRVWIRFWMAVFLLATAGCRNGCDRAAVPADDAVGALMQILPHQTRLIVGIDFDGFRSAPSWQKLSALAARDPADQKLIREMHDRTGLDPLHDIASLLLAFPDDARRSGQFGMVVTGRSMDERRLITFARDQASLRGRDLSQRLHAGHRLWHDRTGGDLEGFFLNGSNFVLGRGGWAERIATLAPPDPVATPKPGPTSEPSAADNPELANLVARIRQAPDGGPAPVLWAAAIVSPELRNTLAADPRYQAAGAINRMALGLDLDPEGAVAIRLRAELSTTAGAQGLIDRLKITINAARSDPKVLLLGLAAHLDAITSEARGPVALVHINLSATQVDDLLDRLATLSRMRRQRP